ncbi:MAG TPA: HAD-IC family P-type ATPase [Actinomycetes bacterium]
MGQQDARPGGAVSPTVPQPRQGDGRAEPTDDHVDPAAVAAVARTRTGPGGLTAAEVQVRRDRGEVNDVPARASRSVRQIVRANVMTRFNAILGVLLVVILVVGPLQDALFGLILVANTGIGVLQELRAKRVLDRLAVVSAPRARVVREGQVGERAAGDVVLDDLLELQLGDQVVVDGVVDTADGLEIDESLLTGEAEPVVKKPDDAVLSGSFVVAGSGRYQATRVGAAAYAQQLADQARRFTLVRSELRAGIDWILRVMTWVLVPTATLLVVSQLTRNTNLDDAIRGSVAGVVTMVPEGLVLLTSIAFAVGVVRLGRSRVLVQELPALEGLARVDVVCLDKTGTLTSGRLSVAELETLDPADPAAEALAALAASDPHPNASLRAVADAFPDPPGWAARAVTPFSSARKWSATDFGEHGVWVLGAPDVVLAARAAPSVTARVEAHAAQGRRVLLLARGTTGPSAEVLPEPLDPVALVVLADQLRGDAADTLRYFLDQGVAVKLISGDHPRTVGALAASLGLPGIADPVDARDLPADPDRLAELMESASVFGRVLPAQKRAMVAALQSRGHVVAMTGDGVNDVLALKDADIGVAMGSGTSATRAVAQLVLLDSRFAVLPGVVAEGRRVIGNVERVANLFLTKTVYATLLAVSVGVARLPFPFLPRHLTVVSALTIGIPGFFLALAPNTRRARPGFVARVARFAIPAGTVAAVATFTAYSLSRDEPGTSLTEARTAATLVLFGVALWILGILARPASPARRALVASMAAAFLLTLAVPAAREFFALDPPRALVWLAAVGVVALAGLALELGWRAAGWVRERVEIRPAGGHGPSAAD